MTAYVERRAPVLLEARWRRVLGALPRPVGERVGVRGAGLPTDHNPSPPPSPYGRGSRPSSPLLLIPFHTNGERAAQMKLASGRRPCARASAVIPAAADTPLSAVIAGLDPAIHRS